jgi:serine O-acetyltransferase
MNSRREYIVFILNLIRCLPHVILCHFHKNRSVILSDIRRNLEQVRKEFGPVYGFIYLFAFWPAFRTIFYYWVQPYDFFLKILCPPLSTLKLNVNHIGEGLVISHGFATVVGAKSIGKNCLICQQVTIGASTYGEPTILDNVSIFSGAVIFGKITIGNNAVIGANATVYKNIPDNSSVLPGTSTVMKWIKPPEEFQRQDVPRFNGLKF